MEDAKNKKDQKPAPAASLEENDPFYGNYKYFNFTNRIQKDDGSPRKSGKRKGLQDECRLNQKIEGAEIGTINLRLCLDLEALLT